MIEPPTGVFIGLGLVILVIVLICFCIKGRMTGGHLIKFHLIESVDRKFLII
jgi:hypothetical protein